MQDTRSFGWASYDANALVNPHLEYYRKNRWILDFGGLPAAINSQGEKVILRINAKTANRPKKSFEDTKVERINGTVKMPGKPVFDDLSVVFYDAIKLKGDTRNNNIPDFSTSDVIERWIELIHQPSAGDAYGALANFKGWAHLHMLEPVVLAPGDEEGGPGQEEPLDPTTAISQTWLYQGIYPKSVEYGALDYSGSDVMEVTVNFSVDRAYRVKKTELSA
jgi:hypothetical protein